jgi:hypothetical protein
MRKGAKVAAALLLLAACAEDKEQHKTQLEAAAQAERLIAQQDDARCQNFGRPGSDAYSDAYIECRTRLENHRAEMRK